MSQLLLNRRQSPVVFSLYTDSRKTQLYAHGGNRLDQGRKSHCESQCPPGPPTESVQELEIIQCISAGPFRHHHHDKHGRRCLTFWFLQPHMGRQPTSKYDDCCSHHATRSHVVCFCDVQSHAIDRFQAQKVSDRALGRIILSASDQELRHAADDVYWKCRLPLRG